MNLWPINNYLCLFVPVAVRVCRFRVEQAREGAPTREFVLFRVCRELSTSSNKRQRSRRSAVPNHALQSDSVTCLYTFTGHYPTSSSFVVAAAAASAKSSITRTAFVYSFKKSNWTAQTSRKGTCCWRASGTTTTTCGVKNEFIPLMFTLWDC